MPTPIPREARLVGRLLGAAAVTGGIKMVSSVHVTFETALKYVSGIILAR